VKNPYLTFLKILSIVLTSSYALADFPISYESYVDWQDLPCLRLGAQAGLASSYDRTGGNRDWSYYEWPEGQIEDERVCTVKTIQGPGMLYRFWMPHCIGINHYVVRMYFDGEITPRIDTESNTIFDGLFSYFSEPLITTVAGGQVCYEPIPFSESLVIETINKPKGPFANQHYYQYSYLTYPQGTDINSWTDTLTPDQNQVRLAVVSMFENVGQHPDGNSLTAIEVNTPAAIIDSNLTLADLEGPGVIRKLCVKMTDANDSELTFLNLRVFYDGQAEPAIDIPVAHFFGAGKERATYQSLPIGTDSNDGFYCYWPMPFRESVLVQLENTSASPIAIDSAKVEYEKKELDHHTCYLHAVENTLVKSGQIYHTILSAQGRGHYVGDLLYVEQDVNSFTMLEGDDVIYADGQLVQNGTGLEDTYNGGAYYNWIVPIPDEPEGLYPQSATRPLNGILYVNHYTDFARADQYRWRISDCIPFSQSIEVNVECRYASNGSRWTSVGFWYQLPHLLEDLNRDGIVNFDDFCRFASTWRQENCGDCSFADFTGDKRVNAHDLADFSKSWLTQTY
jgi:hypothetical protein